MSENKSRWLQLNENDPKPPKEKKQKVYKERSIIKSTKSSFSKTEIKQTEFLYELILSQGLGYRTKKLDNILLDLAHGFVKKFYTEYYLWPDLIQTGMLYMCKSYKLFSRERCNNPLSYFTEICKRAMSMEVSIQKSTSNYGHMDTHKRTFQYVSINGCTF